MKITDRIKSYFSKKLTFDEIMKSQVHTCAVAILRNADDSEKIRLLGSGTIVEYGSIKGILTCAHVIAEVNPRESLGLCIFPIRNQQAQRLRLNSDSYSGDFVLVHDKSTPEEEPDLGFIPLTDQAFGTLLANASSTNLAKTRENIRKSKENGTILDILCVVGAIGERSISIGNRPIGKVLHIEGMSIDGTLAELPEKSWDTHTFDRVLFTPHVEHQSKSPESYGGLSGGGIWRISILVGNDDQHTLLDRELVGCAYFQTDPPKREIVGHGKNSIASFLAGLSSQRVG